MPPDLHIAFSLLFGLFGSIGGLLILSIIYGGNTKPLAANSKIKPQFLFATVGCFVIVATVTALTIS